MIESPKHVARLVRRLASPIPAIRARAEAELRELEADAVPASVDALTSHRRTVSNLHAALALAFFTYNVTRAVLTFLARSYGHNRLRSVADSLVLLFAIGYVPCYLYSLLAGIRLRQAARFVATIPDSRVTQPVIDALTSTNERVARFGEATLLTILRDPANMKFIILTTSQESAVCNLLRAKAEAYSKHFDSGDAEAIIRALAEIGHSESLSLLRAITKSGAPTLGKEHVCDVAAEVLPTLEARVELERVAGCLLRPSQADESLLRPAAATDSQQQLLLHPTAPESATDRVN